MYRIKSERIIDFFAKTNVYTMSSIKSRKNRVEKKLQKFDIIWDNGIKLIFRKKKRKRLGVIK